MPLLNPPCDYSNMEDLCGLRDDENIGHDKHRCKGIEITDKF